VIIGLHGKKQSGKDFVFQTIAKMYPETDWQRQAFADKVKIMQMVALGLEGTDEELLAWANRAKDENFMVVLADTDGYPLFSVTYRRHMQLGATEGVQKHLGQLVWVDALLPAPGSQCEFCDHDPGGHVRVGPKIGSPEYVKVVTRGFRDFPRHFLEDQHVVITDVRFSHEAQRINDLGGEVWRIVGPAADEDAHSSEAELPDEMISETIDNTERLDGGYRLKMQLKRLLDLRIANQRIQLEQLSD